MIAALAAVAAVAPASAASCAPKGSSALAELTKDGKPLSYSAQFKIDHARSLASIRGRDHGLAPQTEADAYVQGIGRRMLDAAGGKSLPLLIRVTAGTGFDAMTAPDGAIYIPVGLLARLETEDELAFVLGHELGHALLKHHDADWFLKVQYYSLLAFQAAEKAMVALDKAQQVGIAAPSFSTEVKVASFLYQANSRVIAPTWKAEQESCSDKLGYDLFVRAGYNPTAASSVLDKFIAYDDAMRKAADAAEKAEKDANGGGGNPFDFIGDFVNKIGDATFKTVKSYPSPRKRRQDIADYEADYATLVPDTPPLKELIPIARSAATPLRAARNYLAADNVMSTIEARKSDTAIKAALAPALTAPTAADAYPLYAKAQAARFTGDPSGRLTALQAARAAREPSIRVYQELIHEREAVRDYDGAIAMLTSAEQRLPGTPQLLPLRIHLLLLNDEKDKADAVYLQCLSYDTFRDLGDACAAQYKEARAEPPLDPNSKKKKNESK